MYHIYISYAAKDKLAAEELTFRLKTYKLPSNISDVKDTGKIQVDASMFSEQEDTQNFLIVICSFNSVKDPAVEKDILQFQEKEPFTHIIPYVISGIPYAKNPANECIPDVLKQSSEEDLLAVNILELGKRKALFRIISTVYGIRLDELEKRTKKQNRRRMLVSAALLIVLAAYIINSEYTTSARTEYYKAMEYINNAPVGIDRLNFIERLYCKDYYIFEINYKNVLSVERIGNAPKYVPEEEALADYYEAIDAPYIQFTYHTDDTMDASIHADEEGRILFVMNYTAGMTAVDFSLGPDGITPYFLTLDGQQTEYSRCILSYDEEGRLKDVQYALNSRNVKP